MPSTLILFSERFLQQCLATYFPSVLSRFNLFMFLISSLPTTIRYIKGLD